MSKRDAYSLLNIVFLTRAESVEKNNTESYESILKKVWPRMQKIKPDLREQISILKTAAGLCGEEEELRDVFLQILKDNKSKNKKRGPSKNYMVTLDRTKKRHMVRARFDGDPWFVVGDMVSVELVILENEPAIVMRKVNTKGDSNEASKKTE